MALIGIASTEAADPLCAAAPGRPSARHRLASWAAALAICAALTVLPAWLDRSSLAAFALYPLHLLATCLLLAALLLLVCVAIGRLVRLD